MNPNWRTAGTNTPADRQKIGLPPRVFMFTIDQIAYMLNVEERTVKTRYLYFEGRSTGRRRLDLLVAVNVAPDDVKPDWRVNERELIRWATMKKLKFVELGTFIN